MSSYSTSLTQTRSNLPSMDVARVNVVSAVMLLVPVLLGALTSWWLFNPIGIIAGLLLGGLLAQSPKIARQWERAVVLRLGKYVGLKGPGLFWIIPFVDTISAWVDQRVITTSFAAEETLTSDTVPVNVDAVLFWMVYDPEKAALEVQNYPQAVSWAAQTALRDIIGRTSLTDLLRGREHRVRIREWFGHKPGQHSSWPRIRSVDPHAIRVHVNTYRGPPQGERLRAGLIGDPSGSRGALGMAPIRRLIADLSMADGVPVPHAGLAIHGRSQDPVWSRARDSGHGNHSSIQPASPDRCH